MTDRFIGLTARVFACNSEVTLGRGTGPALILATNDLGAVGFEVRQSRSVHLAFVLFEPATLVATANFEHAERVVAVEVGNGSICISDRPHDVRQHPLGRTEDVAGGLLILVLRTTGGAEGSFLVNRATETTTGGNDEGHQPDDEAAHSLPPCCKRVVKSLK